MKNSIISLFALLTFCFARFVCSINQFPELGYDPQDLSSEKRLLRRFEEWVGKHSKVYNDYHEKQMRLNIFKENLRYIHERNQRNLSYVIGLNEFSDLTHEEFKSIYASRLTTGQKNVLYCSHQEQKNSVLPVYVDWREKGAVTPVKKQHCGDCWSFSSIAAVESIHQIATGDLISLSEQQLDDCDILYGTGCDGGNPGNAFLYIMNNSGIASEADYPYTSPNAACNKELEKKHAVSIDGCVLVTRFNETAMKIAVASQPISVAIEGSARDFLAYKSGIFTADQCGTTLDHSVSIVGYNREAGLDYWIAKNSWGPTWGEEGYIRLQRNVANPSGVCGLALYPYYPTKT